MLDNLPDSDTKPIEGTLGPEDNGQSQHAPLPPETILTLRRFYDSRGIQAEVPDQEFIERLAAERHQRIIAGLGRSASWQEVVVAEMAHAQSRDIDTVTLTVDAGSQTEIVDGTIQYARTAAKTIVKSVDEIREWLLRQRGMFIESRLMPNRPASRLLIAGKLIAAIVEEQSKTEPEPDPDPVEVIIEDEDVIRSMLEAVIVEEYEEKEIVKGKEQARDNYVHADECVSILRDTMHAYYEDFDEDTIDAISVIAYIHDSYKKIRDKEGRYLEDKTIITSPLVVQCVLEELNVEPGRIDQMINAYQLMTALPGPDESSDKYYEYIENGCNEGGMWFILPKMACIWDMLQLEENSPIQHGATNEKDDKYAERLHAWTLLSRAAHFRGFTLLPGRMQQLTSKDLKTAKYNKSYFELEEAARTVIARMKVAVNS